MWHSGDASQEAHIIIMNVDGNGLIRYKGLMNIAVKYFLANMPVCRQLLSEAA